MGPAAADCIKHQVEQPELVASLGAKELKQQVKAAKVTIPYRRTEDAADAPAEFSKCEMVELLVEQRQGFRCFTL